eukprot:9921435-Ditylum_brightwellii.AAC.1
MKFNLRSLKSAKCSFRNMPLPILLYVPEKKGKSSPSNYQVYKLWTNPKDKKMTMYSLTFKYYEVIKGQDIMDLEVAYILVKSLLQVDALQVFQNKEAVQKERDGP